MRSSLLFGCLALSFAGGCSDRSASTASGDTGGTFVIAYPGQAPAAVFPALATDEISRLIGDQIYERLAEMGPDMNTVGDAGYEPRLARSWTWAPDSMSIAFSIDPRAHWHDGQPVTARDVAFTYALAKDPKTGGVIAPVIGNIDSVTLRDSMTAVFWFHRRNAEQFYDATYQLQIVPEHLLKDVPRDKLATSDFMKQPVGTGRFRFLRLDPGVRAELIADTANYRGRAKLDRVIVAFVSDGAAGITQLMSGQADYFDSPPPDVWRRIDSSKTLRMLRYPGIAYGFMGMQLRDPQRPGQPHPIFGDVRVRRAISMALDRQAMARNVFDTMTAVATGPYTRGLGDTTVALPPFDRARAAALLDSAGWRMGPDGVRAKNGKRLVFTLLAPSSSVPRMRYAVLIQEQLKPLGAQVQIESVDFSSFISKLDSRKFDAMINVYQTDPARSGIRQNWGSVGTHAGGQNAVNYMNPRFDALVDSAVSTSDKTRAQSYAHRAYQILADEAPAVWLYEGLSVGGIHRRIRPEIVRSDGWWQNLAEWSIPAGERIDRDRIGLRPAQP